MISTFLFGIGTVLAKNLFGWAKNSLEDGEIQGYEVKKGLISIGTAALVFTGAFFGLQGFDASNTELWSSLIALLISPIVDKLFTKYGWFQ